MRGMFLRTKTGVSCPKCGANFIILQTRAVIAGITILILGVSLGVCAAIRLDRLLGHHLSGFETAAVFVPILILMTVAHLRVTPVFARVRVAANNESADYPLSRYRHARRI